MDMSFVKRLTEAGMESGGCQRVLLKTTQLKKNHMYRIGSCREVRTRFGKRVILGLGSKYDYFLPNRLMKCCTFKEMNAAANTGRFGLIYKGSTTGTDETVCIFCVCVCVWRNMMFSNQFHSVFGTIVRV